MHKNVCPNVYQGERLAMQYLKQRVWKMKPWPFAIYMLSSPLPSYYGHLFGK